MEKTLVIIKPGAIKRQLIGTIIDRFERKGLRLAAIKVTQLTDDILNEHYAHISKRPFFESVKNSMKSGPVVVCCWEGIDAVKVVREMTGTTNSREANPGTIRGDYGMSGGRNIIHTSDSIKNAQDELDRFFKQEEYCHYKEEDYALLYSEEELRMISDNL